MHALQHTTHPSAFDPLFEVVEGTLLGQSHPNFIRWSICNGNKPRVLFVQYSGIISIFVAMVLAICLILSHVSRWWRIITFVFWFIGIDIFVAAYKGLCVVIHTDHSRALRPWEQFPALAAGDPNGFGNGHVDTSTTNIVRLPASSPVSSDVLSPSLIDPIGMRIQPHEDCMSKYDKQHLLKKIFSKTVWVQDEAVRVLQDKIIWQSHCWAVIVAVPITVIIVALPVSSIL